MKEVYLVQYQHYGETQYFNTFDYYRAVDYAAQHKGTIYRCKEWLAIEYSSKISQPLCTTEKAACCQSAGIVTPALTL